MKGHDVVCLGEALVDFLPDARGLRVRDVRAWTPHLGGAPANVAVGVSRLGGRSALVAVTGDDEFGHFLLQRLGEEGVDTRGVRQTREGRTGLGFVSLTAGGERSFVFYRQRSAETFLGPQDTEGARGPLARARVLHVGTNSLLKGASRRAVLSAVLDASRGGRLVSADPNLRLHLWPRPQVLQRLLARLLPRCAVVKLSEEETRFVVGTRDVEEALRQLEQLGVLLPIVTLGPAGAAFRSGGQTSFVPAPAARVVDTTGAGDGFTAGLLFALTRLCRTRADLAAASHERVRECVAFGCVVGSRVVRRMGAVAGLPRAVDVRRRMPAWLRSP